MIPITYKEETVQYREYRPAPALRDFVQHYWVYGKEEQDTEFELDLFTPEVSPFLVFQLGGGYETEMNPGEKSPHKILAAGGCREAVPVRLPGRSLSAGVRFTAAGAAALGAFRPGELGGIEPYEIHWARDAREQMGNALKDEVSDAQDWAVAATILDTTFIALLRTGSVPVDADRWRSVEQTLESRGWMVSMEKIANRTGQSLRSLERTCMQVTGYTPAEYRNVLRCDTARAVLNTRPAVDETSLALDLGFCDLPHFCRTFKRWSGQTPAEYRRRALTFRPYMTGPNEMTHLHERARRYESITVMQKPE